MNPSTEDIVAAVDATPATEVIVLPNNSNVILSAEQAVDLVNKPMRVVPTRSVQAGLAAMIAYDPELAASENETAMIRAQDGVATGEVTIASRNVTLDGIEVRKGAWLGLADGAAVASGQSFDAERTLGIEPRQLGRTQRYPERPRRDRPPGLRARARDHDAQPVARLRRDAREVERHVLLG